MLQAHGYKIETRCGRIETLSLGIVVAAANRFLIPRVNVRPVHPQPKVSIAPSYNPVVQRTLTPYVLVQIQQGQPISESSARWMGVPTTKEVQATAGVVRVHRRIPLRCSMRL